MVQIDETKFNSLRTPAFKKREIQKRVLEYHTQTGFGARKIHQILEEQYASKLGSPILEYLPHFTTIHRWIQDDKKDKPYDLAEAKEHNIQLYPYLNQLQLLNNAIFEREVPITEFFKYHAERCLYRFNDPLGQTIDLYAQYCVIRELYERERIAREDSVSIYTKDIDLILDYTTWLYEGEPDESPYALAVKKEIQLGRLGSKSLIPNIHYTAPKKDVELLYGIYAFLRLPHHFMTITWAQERGVEIVTTKKAQEKLRKEPIARPMIDNWLKNVSINPFE